MQISFTDQAFEVFGHLEDEEPHVRLLRRPNMGHPRDIPRARPAMLYSHRARNT